MTGSTPTATAVVFDIVVNSAHEEAKPDLETTLSVPITDGQLAFAIGSDEPEAQAIANYYAGEYCDSGTVVVINRADPRDRAYVHRRSIS